MNTLLRWIWVPGLRWGESFHPEINETQDAYENSLGKGKLKRMQRWTGEIPYLTD